MRTRTVDLQSLSKGVPVHAAHVLGLLYLEARFTPDPWVRHADIYRQLSAMPASGNHSQVLGRARDALAAALGADFIERRKQGRESLIALRRPLTLKLTLGGHEVTPRTLAEFLGIETRTDGALRAMVPEADLRGAIRSTVDAERDMVMGDVAKAAAGIHALRKTPTGRHSPRVNLWAELHQMRLLRISEQWPALERMARRVGRRAENALRAKSPRNLPKRHAEALAAASILSRAWILYHRARSGVPGARYEAALELLEPIASRAFFASNLWCHCERYNLLALILRRMATGEPSDDANRALRVERAAQSLAYNHHAIELAGLGGNQHSLATYCSNRALLLADLAGAGLIGQGASRAESPWHSAAQWLALGEDLSRWLGGGADVTWSGPYLLMIVRHAEAHATWPELRLVLADFCRSYPYRPDEDLVANAIAFSQPAMDKMLTELEAGLGVDRFRRQLLALCRELAHAARRDGVCLAAYEPLHRLRAWVGKQTRLGAAEQNDRAAFLASFEGAPQARVNTAARRRSRAPAATREAPEIHPA